MPANAPNRAAINPIVSYSLSKPLPEPSGIIYLILLRIS